MDIKINYKGTNCRGVNYLYHCPVCGHEQEASHPASTNPPIHCNKCGHCMNKKPTTLHLDAELHENGKSHNIGWDYDDSEE